MTNGQTNEQTFVIVESLSRLKMFQMKSEARNSYISKIMKEGWSSHLRSEFDGNCIFVDGLGDI